MKGDEAGRARTVPEEDACQQDTLRAAEFFAGIGLMRAGLDRCSIETVFANDVDETKAAIYRDNWGDEELVVGDIRDLTGAGLPDGIDLATASSPCVDVSLARISHTGKRRTAEGVVRRG